MSWHNIIEYTTVSGRSASSHLSSDLCFPLLIGACSRMVNGGETWDFQDMRNRCSTLLWTDTSTRTDRDSNGGWAEQSWEEETWLCWNEKKEFGLILICTHRVSTNCSTVYCILLKHNLIIHRLDELVSSDPAWLSFLFHLSRSCMSYLIHAYQCPF